MPIVTLKAPAASHEQGRTQALYALQLLDSEPDPAWDNIAHLAAALCDCPVALITLVDNDRVWCKSRFGFEHVQIPRSQSLCDYVIDSASTMVVADVSADSRFQGEAYRMAYTGLRFYAGVALVLEPGFAVGTLCVMDHTARTLTAQQLDCLTRLATQAVALLEARRSQMHLQIEGNSSRLGEQGPAFGLEGAEVGYWDMDLRSNTARCSIRHDQCFGYTGAVPVWRYDTFLEHVLEADRARVNDAYARAKAGESSLDIEFRVVWPDLSVHWLWSKGRSHLGDEGKPKRLAGIVVDITGRRSAQEKPPRPVGIDTAIAECQLVEAAPKASNLQLQLQLLETCVARLNDIVLITEAEPVNAPGPQIVFVNDAFVRRTGFSREEAIGQTPRILQGPKTQRKELDRIRTALERWEPVRAELINYTKAGEEFWLELDIVPVANADGWYTHWIAVERDITERRAAETSLALYQQHLEELVEERTSELKMTKEAAESANQAKSVFLANISHELRTPLGGVMGMTDLALGRATDPQQMDWLNKSRRSALHLMSVINDVLDLSKIEAHRLTLEQQNFSLSQVMADAMLMLDDAAKAKSLDLTLELDPSLSYAVCGDALRLKQIVINYLSNAVKFSERGSVILRVQRLAQDETGTLLRIEVSDQGLGISAQQQAGLFQPFSQADTSTTRKFGGTGLGLVISLRIAQMMGGDAGVRSQEGSGSTFWATVRLAHAVEEHPIALQFQGLTSKDLAQQGFSGQRVLLVDDDEVNQEVGVLMLEAAGLVVDVANQGAEAVDKARLTDYALILMDVQMPVMNGLEASRAIRLLPGRNMTPIVALSANAFPEDRERSSEAGMNDHLVKPVLPDVLYASLLRWLA